MTHFEKVRLLQMALEMQNFDLCIRHVDQVLTTYSVIKRVGGNFSLNDAAEIEVSMDRQYPDTEEDEAIVRAKNDLHEDFVRKSLAGIKAIPTSDLLKELSVRNITVNVSAKESNTETTEREEIDVTKEKPVEKRHYTPRKTNGEKKTVRNPPPDTSLSGNMLGAFLRKAAVINRLTALGPKYGAGTPMRMRTLIFKHGSPDLLHTDINMVSEKALLSLPRTGKTMWKIFQEIRDFAMPKEVKKSEIVLRTNDFAKLDKVIEMKKEVITADRDRDTIASAVTAP